MQKIGFSRNHALAKLAAVKIPYTLWAHRETKEVFGCTGLANSDEDAGVLLFFYGIMAWRDNEKGAWIQLTDDRGHFMESSRAFAEEVAAHHGINLQHLDFVHVATNSTDLEWVGRTANDMIATPVAQPAALTLGAGPA